MNSIFIFRLDLRLFDNLGLIECFSKSNKIYPIFIFDPIQIDREKNKYFSDNCVQFMIESLKELYYETNNLTFFYGDTITVLEHLIKNNSLGSIFLNNDYSPFSIKRDNLIKKLCEKNKIEFMGVDDILLNNINEPKKNDNSPYMTFTSYYNNSNKNIEKPNKINITSKLSKINSKLYEIKHTDISKFYQNNENINVNGGRENALKILTNIKNLKDYNDKRSLCNYKTSQLSAYIKFGCVSIREVYHSFINNLGKSNDLVKQLYWREFYYYLLYHFPETYTKKQGLKKIYKNFPWSNDKKKFNAWCKGETGFPIVDASMKNLNETGYMPNRSRLIVANFLTKILRIDWKMGERYFAQNLVDYSVSNNLGNWQWVASIGADYQNRIYNPMTQSEKSDPECLYIRKWIPELETVPIKHIHNWNKYYNNYNIDYYEPIIDYKNEYKISKSMFKQYI